MPVRLACHKTSVRNILITSSTCILVCYTVFILTINRLKGQSGIKAFFLAPSKAQLEKELHQEQLRRKKRIVEFCKATQHIKKPVQQWLAIHDMKNKALYCPIKGCGSISWRKMMLYLTGRLLDPIMDLPPLLYDDISIQAITSGSAKHIVSMKPDLVSFLFVRDPWERLVAAYIALVLESNYARVKERPCSWYNYRDNSKDKKLSFHDFITCIVIRARRNGSADLDEAWRPQYLSCDICSINYTYVGHMETLERDFSHIMKLIGRTEKYLELAPPNKHSMGYAKSVVKDYFKHFSPAMISQLQIVYKLDILLHGYSNEPP